MSENYWERFRVVPFEVKMLEEKSDRYEFKGYASVFNKPDRAKDIMHPGAFKRTIDHNGGKFAVDWMHDIKTIIGGGQVHEDGKGLAVEPGYLVKGIQKAEEVYQLMKADVVDGMSFMYKALQKKMIRGYRNLYEVRVGSLTVGPSALICHPDALITDVKFWEENNDSFDTIFDDQLNRLNMILFDDQKLWEDQEHNNEIKYQMQNPDDFTNLKAWWLPNHISSIAAIGGPKIAGGPIELKSLRFKKDAGWTLSKAKEWIADHEQELKFDIITANIHYELAEQINLDTDPVL